jgi:hypothetical protein
MMLAPAAIARAALEVERLAPRSREPRLHRRAVVVGVLTEGRRERNDRAARVAADVLGDAEVVAGVEQPDPLRFAAQQRRAVALEEALALEQRRRRRNARPRRAQQPSVCRRRA